MDADLVAEVNRLQAVYAEQGLQVFRYACLEVWETPRGSAATSPLFRASSPDGTECARPDGRLCGCLNEIKEPHWPTGPRVAWMDEWTEAIKADPRIPWTIGELYPEQLWAFAEWQQTFRDYFHVHLNGGRH
jgi:hypothetical protein